MKQFFISNMEVIPSGYVVIGRNDGDKINIGDQLSGCVVSKIEAYGKELQSLGAGMTATLTLKGFLKIRGV